MLCYGISITSHVGYVHARQERPLHDGAQQRSQFTVHTLQLS